MGAYEAQVELPGCPTITITAGWASATDDVWFVGSGSFHYDGVTWRAIPVSAALSLLGIWGTSRTDVWAVGKGGVIVHYDGEVWTSVASPTAQDLAAVWASGPCDVSGFESAYGRASLSRHPFSAERTSGSSGALIQGDKTPRASSQRPLWLAARAMRIEASLRRNDRGKLSR
jgi:hypothetical protein